MDLFNRLPDSHRRSGSPRPISSSAVPRIVVTPDTWTRLSPVRSPVFLKTPDSLQRSHQATPQLTSRESLDALAAAVKAYDQAEASGPPACRRAQQAVERFVAAMRTSAPPW